MHKRELAPALEWVTTYADQLETHHSVLEFKLHRLAFMQILSNGMGSQTAAIAYARKYFAKFVNTFEKDIQILMGSLMYLPVGIENSPYKDLNSTEMWFEVYFN